MKNRIICFLAILLLSTSAFAQMGPGHSFPPSISFTYGDYSHKIIFFNYGSTNARISFYIATYVNSINAWTVGPFDIEVRANSSYTFDSTKYGLAERGDPITHIIPWNKDYSGKVNFPRPMHMIGPVASPFQGYNVVSMANNIPPYGQNTPTITINNTTGYTIVNVFVRPSSTINWGDNKLGSNILYDKYFLPVRLPYPLGVANRYDIMLKDSDGDTYTKFNVPVTANASIYFTFKDIYW